jgi:hypothetical protein
MAETESRKTRTYSGFTLDALLSDFSLRSAQTHFNHDTVPVSASETLLSTLEENLEVAVAVGNERARCELLVVPILMEVRRHLKKNISLFSGISFSIDPDRGLNGECDYVLSASPDQLRLSAPVVTVVEAKKNDLQAGWGQCGAEMVAARIFNRNTPFEHVVYGAVTTGTIWQFLRLTDDLLEIEPVERSIEKSLPDILGALCRPFPVAASASI